MNARQQRLRNRSNLNRCKCTNNILINKQKTQKNDKANGKTKTKSGRGRVPLP